MPTLDDKLNELVRDICSLDYIKTKSEMRRRIMEVTTAYARSIVPELPKNLPDGHYPEPEEMGYYQCRTEILNKISEDEKNVWQWPQKRNNFGLNLNTQLKEINGLHLDSGFV